MVRFLVSDQAKLLANIGARLNRNDVENNTLNNVVDRFKFIIEEMSQSDELIRATPVWSYTETMGISPWFRFDYDRFDYGRFGDTGGWDDISYYRIIYGLYDINLYGECVYG